jgi:hypothetical protein
MATNTTLRPVVARCECGAMYRDDNYLGEGCRQCHRVIMR